MTLTARTDRTLIRSMHSSERYVLVELTAPEGTRSRERDPLNLAFVLDRSGSMGGEKIRIARQAIHAVVEHLGPQDRFSVVAYDDRIEVVVPSTSGSPEARRTALERLDLIDARGSTNLFDGYLHGAEQVATQLLDRGLNRVLLLTDGLANVGRTDPAEITRHVAELRARGVTTTTFGIGTDHDEALLQGMADAGGGHFYFIERAVQIRDLIASEVGELLETVARDVVVHLTAPAAIAVGTIAPHPIEQRGERTLVRLGDLTSGQAVELVFRVRFGYGPIGAEVGAIVGITDRDGVFSGEGVVGLGWRFADDVANDEQPRDRVVDRAVAKLFAARVRQEAVAMNRQGDYRGAGRALGDVAERIAGYAGDDPELRELVAALRREVPVWREEVPEISRKQQYALASMAMHSRDMEGKALRRGPNAPDRDR